MIPSLAPNGWGLKCFRLTSYLSIAFLDVAVLAGSELLPLPHIAVLCGSLLFAHDRLDTRLDHRAHGCDEIVGGVFLADMCKIARWLTVSQQPTVAQH